MSGEAAPRQPVIDVMGPLTVKEVEALVFVAARGRPGFEASQRTWLEDDRSWFIRWREARDGSAPRIIGLVHAYQLPEMACRVELLSFDDEPHAALRTYADGLLGELQTEGFT